jgi:hypothetical protein
VLVAALGLMSGTCQAQEALPEPASISVPDVATSDPKVLAQGHKFFFFHRADTSFADAVSDIATCRSFMRRGELRPLSKFIPWEEPASRAAQRAVSPYGLVGAVISSIITPKLDRGADNNILRRCMEPRGYQRFPVAEAIWNDMNGEKDEQRNILMQAKLASGPEPSTPAVRDE